ncbi:MAG TPA: outer membrane beta-barrel protein [Chitinophagaceae bacterium]|nr:outer membrane beta-barrel protein [Chitinophagaceae bacterium]
MIFTIRIKLFIALLLLFSVGIRAQSLKGRLVDLNSNRPLRRASINLSSLKDSTQRFNTISDSSGRFEFRNLYQDSFILRISFVGYDGFNQIVGIKSAAVDLGTLFIPKTIKELGEVVVVSKVPPVQQKGDTLEYNASQFKVNPDATAEDMVKKLPGVTVDKQGTVTAQGEQVRKVTIDGRDFFGDDATAALRNLPAEIIDKIQVFDRLSDQAQFTGFDDGNTLKAVNIVTKANMRNGQFGRIYAGYGTDDRYAAGGNVSFFKDNRRISLVGNFNNINQQNFASQDLLGVTSGGGNRGGFGGFGGRQGNRGGGNRAGGGGNFGSQSNFLVGQQSGITKTNAAGTNYSDQWGKKVTVAGSYFFNNSNNLNNQVTNQQSLNGTDFYKESSLSKNNNYNHRINLRLDYKIYSANSILITPSINLQKNDGNSIYSTNAGFGETVKSSSNNTANTDVSGYNISNNILFRHAFPKKGRTISVGVTTSFNRKSGNSYVVGDNKSFDSTGVLMQDSIQNQFSDNFTNGNTISTNVAYTEPTGKKGELQFNYNPSFTKSRADQETYQFNNSEQKYSLFDTALSNKFTNNYATQNGGISYRKGDRDKQISVGINFQYSKLSSDQQFPAIGSIRKSFTDFLPNLQFRKKLSLRSSINIFLRTSVSPPSVSQLQNVYNVNNPLVISIGNPDLKQQYTGSLVARYTFTNTQKGQSFFANLFLQKTNNYIANSVYHAQNDSVLAPTVILLSGGQLTVPVNLDGYWTVRSLFTFGQPVKLIKSNLNLNAGVMYSRLPGLIDKQKLLTDNYNYSVGAVIASNVSEYVDFNLSYNANFNIIAGQPENNQVSQSVGVQFNLLSKTGWFFQNDLNNQAYNYKGSTPDQSFWLWNISAGKKFLKQQKGELKFTVFDLLKQNRAISRTVTEAYVEDTQSRVLQQYFMMTFTYKLKNFGAPKTNNKNNNNSRPNF